MGQGQTNLEETVGSERDGWEPGRTLHPNTRMQAEVSTAAGSTEHPGSTLQGWRTLRGPRTGAEGSEHPTLPL